MVRYLISINMETERLPLKWFKTAKYIVLINAVIRKIYFHGWGGQDIHHRKYGNNKIFIAVIKCGYSQGELAYIITRVGLM